jgi:VCBS repeat-containing protein
MSRSGRRGSVASCSLALAAGALALALASPIGVGAAGPAASSAQARVIVTFTGKPGAAAKAAVRAAHGQIKHTYTLINGMVVTMPAASIAGLRHAKGVKSVEIDGTVTTMEPVTTAASTGDLEYDNAWGVTHIGSKAVHDAGIRGQGVKVAVIDTGVDYIHDQPPALEPPVVDPEFLNIYKGGYDFVNNDSDPMDDNGHGTHVAGILAAEHNGYLVVGVAPAVDLYALKILDASGSGDVSNLILALQWAVGHGINVANMSLGTHEISPALATAVANASAAGLLMVAAAGNIVTIQELFQGCPVTYPGAYPQVLSTTFTNESDALTGYSCTGPEVDFAAPGDNIFSPVPVGSCMLCSPNGYAAESGTSMASPHLAGTVALLLSAGITDTGAPGLFDDVRNRLCTTANVGWGVQSAFGSTQITPSDPRYPNWFGCGVVDAGEAVLGLNPPPPNDPPVAAADTAAATEDTAVDVAVLVNDTDPNGDTLSVTNATDAPHGTTSVNANGTVHYVPDANYNGGDGFSYSISDGHGGTASATVAVTVSAVNDNPVAVNDTASTSEDTPIDVNVLGNDTDVDGDALTLTGVSGAVKGTATLNVNGTVHFVPTANANGTGAFQYSISDGHGGTAGASAQVTIGAVNDPPVAVNDSATTGQGVPVTISVLANDTDIDSASLAVSGVSNPAHGTAVANANGTVTYTPNAGYSGPDAFGYTATDGSAISNLATVSITVTAAPPPNLFHIGDLDGATSISGKNWTAKVTIRVHDGTHSAVSGVVLTGLWSNGASGSASCTTAANGSCTVQSPKLSRTAVASVTFTVTAATRSGWTYVPALNHDPDADSTGTAIVVLRPN